MTKTAENTAAASKPVKKQQNTAYVQYPPQSLLLFLWWLRGALLDRQPRGAQGAITQSQPVDFLSALNHIINFFLPAVAVAGGVALVGPYLGAEEPVVRSRWGQFAVHFVVCATALLIGLVMFGRDGKMATYLGMCASCALSAFVLLRAWRV